MGNGVQLEIKQLTKRFGSKSVLKGLNLKIQKGQFVAIVGKSGCGKSTLLRHIAALEMPTGGEIIQNGVTLGKTNDLVRFMFQEDRLLPWLSIIENVGVGLGLKDQWQHASQEALKQVGLEDYENEWPSVLSGGQRQRVALARALVANPRLLLFDEPLGALDALTRMEMQELIEKLWLDQRYTSILVTHDISEAIVLADRVILLEEGSVKLDIAIDLPRPRQRSSVEFVNYEKLVLSHVLNKKEGINEVSEIINQKETESALSKYSV